MILPEVSAEAVISLMKLNGNENSKIETGVLQLD